VIFRNHSNVSKPAFVIQRVFIVVQEINYPPCFIVYYKIKQKSIASHYSVDHTANPALLERIQRVSLRTVSSLCRYFREQHKKFRRHDRRKFVPSGWDWMAYGSCHKSLKTHFDWPETLTLSCELLKLSCDWLFRPQTTVETTDNCI